MTHSKVADVQNDSKLVIFGPKITFTCSLKHFSSKFFLLNGFRRNVFCLFFDSSSISAAYQLFRKSENSEFSKIFQKFFKNFLLWSLLTVFFFSRLVRWFVTVRSLSLDWIRKKGTKEKMTKSGARESLITLYVTNISNINSDKIVHQKKQNKTLM